MDAYKNELIELLKRSYQREYCSLTGNATSGIYCSLKALGISNRKIAIPAGVCINLPIAIFASGNLPLYIDISEQNLGIDSSILYNLYEKPSSVIAVHSYGNVCDIGRISEYCEKYNIPLIEDFAVAQGIQVAKNSYPNDNNIVLLSFGAGKIIDAGHGGAVLTNDRKLHDAIEREIVGLENYNSTKRERIENFSNYHTKFYNLHYGKEIESYSYYFKEKMLENLENYLFRFDEKYSDAIFHKILGLDKNLEERWIKVQLFKKELENCIAITIFEPPEGSVYWRFNILLDRNRDKVLKILLEKKYKISSWYPSVDMFFESNRSNSQTPVSDRIGDTILNLWVNDEVDANYVKMISTELRQILSNGAK